MKRRRDNEVQDAQKYVDFRQRKQAAQLTARVRLHLKRSQLACHQLDKKCGYSSPVLDWYWPDELASKTEDASCSDSDYGTKEGGEEEEEDDDDEAEVWVEISLRLEEG